MNANYLYAAYLVTWAIHGTYLYILARKAKRVRREIERLRRSDRWSVTRAEG